jgi:hypothetical protein
MTRGEAVKIIRAFGMTKFEADIRERLPQRLCDRICDMCAEDEVDGLMALGVLKCDPPSPAPETYCTIDGRQWCEERSDVSRCPDCPVSRPQERAGGDDE